MTMKKKELLEQENSVPETTALDSTAIPADDMVIPDVASTDSEDLNTLLATMDLPDDAGTLPELAENEVFGDTPVGKDEDDAELPSAEDADAEQNGETVDDYSEELPADQERADEEINTAPNSETVEKPQRISRKKKTTAASETAAAEVPVPRTNTENSTMDEAFVEDTAMEDEAVSADTTVPIKKHSPEVTASQAPPRRQNAQSRRDTSILTIRSREDVETTEDRENIIWHEIHNAYRIPLMPHISRPHRLECSRQSSWGLLSISPLRAKQSWAASGIWIWSTSQWWPAAPASANTIGSEVAYPTTISRSFRKPWRKTE